MEAQEIAVRLGVAVLFGGLIGFERQWRQRMAGLRTNSLVAVGAAGFVVFSTMVSGDNSPTWSRPRSFRASAFSERA